MLVTIIYSSFVSMCTDFDLEFQEHVLPVWCLRFYIEATCTLFSTWTCASLTCPLSPAPLLTIDTQCNLHDRMYDALEPKLKEFLKRCLTNKEALEACRVSLYY